jgi:biopolymer transport protein TolR
MDTERNDSYNETLMSDINVTPLVDVMLVLLIIFMVAAPMMTQGVDVKLPEVATGSLSHSEEPFIVTVDKKEHVYINDFRVEISGIKDKLTAILKEKPGKRVYLKADTSVPYGTVVKVMAEVKEAGVPNLGMITEPPAEKK